MKAKTLLKLVTLGGKNWNAWLLWIFTAKNIRNKSSYDSFKTQINEPKTHCFQTSFLYVGLESLLRFPQSVCLLMLWNF